MNNIGRTIQDFYCNGFAGRRYDMSGATIEAEADDYIIARTTDGEPVYMEFLGYEDGKPTRNDWRFIQKQELIDKWCGPQEDY
jgi:hypothetical protein